MIGQVVERLTRFPERPPCYGTAAADKRECYGCDHVGECRVDTLLRQRMEEKIAAR